MNDHDKPRRRFRFSLLNLLTLMTIAALGLGLFASARKNAVLSERNESLATENLKHRNELGVFDVTDSKKTHAIRVPTEDNEPRKYRLFLPAGRQYLLKYSVNRIPKEGIPPQKHGDVFEPGHYLLKVKLTRRTGKKSGEPIPYGNVDLDIKKTEGIPGRSASYSIGISESKNDWLVNKLTGSTAFSWQEMGRELKTFDADKPIVFYRARANTPVIRARRADGKPGSWTNKIIDGQCDGFMVWFEVKKPEE